MTAGRKAGRLAGRALGWTLAMAYIGVAVGCNGMGPACVWDDAGELVDWGWWRRRRARDASAGISVTRTIITAGRQPKVGMPDAGAIRVGMVVYVGVNDELRALEALLRARRSALEIDRVRTLDVRIRGVRNLGTHRASIYLASEDGRERLVGRAANWDEMVALMDLGELPPPEVLK